MAKSSKVTKVRTFLSFVAGLVIFLLPRHSLATNQVRIGVIPFENITKSEEINWFSQGVAKAISLEMAKNPKLKVIEIEQIKRVFAEMGLLIGSGITLAISKKVGINLMAHYLVIGNFQQFGSDIKIDAHITEVSSGMVLHSEKVVGKVNEIFSLQDGIVEAISRAINKILSGQDEPVAAAPPPPPPPPPPPQAPPTKPTAKSQKEIEDAATRNLIAQQRGLPSAAAGAGVPSASPPGTFRSKENEATRALMQEKQKNLTASEWYNKGVRLNDNSDEEVAYYREAIRTDPTFAPPYYNLGLILFNRGMKQEAIEYFEKYLVYSKNDSEKARVRELLEKIGSASPPAQTGPAIITPQSGDDLPVFYEDRGPGVEP